VKRDPHMHAARRTDILPDSARTLEVRTSVVPAPLSLLVRPSISIAKWREEESHPSRGTGLLLR
jgi:hypothetical protein